MSNESKTTNAENQPPAGSPTASLKANLRDSAWRRRVLMSKALQLPPALFLFIFFVIPFIIMVIASLRYPGEFGGLEPFNYNDFASNFSLETYEFFFSDWFYLGVFAKSFGLAFVTTIICIVMAYPVSWMIARSPKRNRDLLVLLVVLPFASNFLVRIYAWMIILGPQSVVSSVVNAALGWIGLGPVRLLFSTFAVLVGMVYVHLPFMILPLYTNLEKHDPSLLDAAQDLGANTWQRFWKVTFPLSLPGIFSGSVLVFVPVLGMFAVTELLGGTNDYIIGNLIKEQFFGTRDWPLGSALSILLMISVLLLTALASFLAKWWTKGRMEG